MSLMQLETAPANHDDHVDQVISQCMNPSSPKSFFLYAGAGSGKTRSLVTALESFTDKYSNLFLKQGYQVAIITYTNTACDEITERVFQYSRNSENLFHISTIHSFCWLLIQGFHSDIQSYLLENIPDEIDEISEKERKGRVGTKASIDRQRKIKSLQERLQWLSIPRKFTYNPNGDNFGQTSLSHSEVLKITASFILEKPIMRAILVKKFPFILIDESQDTNKQLMDAFLNLENEKQGNFALGLFGDQMQRIYLDGKEKLADSIPARWEKPEKKLNHRSPKRIIQLGNTLRSMIDQHYQKARSDSDTGVVRLFVVPENVLEKTKLEKQIKGIMEEITNDELWVAGADSVKSLTLEHHMSAKRMGFSDLFTALDGHSSLATGLRDGSLPGLRFFSEIIDPTVQAYNADNHFELMMLCRKYSELLKYEAVVNCLSDDHKGEQDPLKHIRKAINKLISCANNENATFEDVLKVVAEDNIFPIPNNLQPFTMELDAKLADDIEEKNDSSHLSAWRTFLESPYKQIRPYSHYIEGSAEFDTHQGVKGREFDRVFVVISDSEARGFLYSYEKLLGTKPVSPSDTKKMNEGKDTSQSRTLRLLYVTCTRAEKSLALVVYSNNPTALKKHVVSQGWFLEDEIIELPFS